MTAAGAQADLSAVEAWLSLVGGDPAAVDLAAKITDCVAGLGTDPASWTWDNAAQVLEGLCRASTG